MHALGRLVGALLLVATAASVAADPPAAAPRPQDIRTLIAPPRATLSPHEIVTRLASPDLEHVQEGVRQLWCPPRGEWDDATLRRMVAALADAAHHPVKAPFHDCGTGSERWPRAESSGVAAAMLSVGAQAPEALLAVTRHPRVEARLEAIEALDALPSAESRDRYIEMLRDPEPRVRLSAAGALDRMRPCGFQDELTPLLGDASEEVRRHVAVILATCGRRDAMPVLAAACDAPTIFPFAPPRVPEAVAPWGDCAELPRLVTEDHGRAWLEARVQEVLREPQPPPAADGFVHPDLGPLFSWSAWWKAHGSDVDMLARNVALAREWESRVGSTLQHRAISVSLLERACDESGLRSLEAANPGPRSHWPLSEENFEIIRARLVPGSLAATALRRDIAPHLRSRSLERLFRVDRLRARAIQLRLLEGPELADVDAALRVADSFPLPPRAVHAAVLAWARRDAAGTSRILRYRSEIRECDIACLVRAHLQRASDACECDDGTP